MKLCCKCFSEARHKTSAYCKQCLVDYSRKRYDLKKQELKAKQNLYSRQNKNKVYAANKKWKQQNLELAKNLSAKWKKENAGRVNAKCKERRLAVKNAVPKWVDKEELWLIEEAYNLSQLRGKMFGIQFHVDHIVPILGKNVCGLHTINNLQVIPAIENCRKGNRIF